MRICVASRRNLTRDPAMRALVSSLDSVGHQVTVVCPGEPEPGLPARVKKVTPNTGEGRFSSLLRRVRRSPKGVQLDTALRRTVAEADPDLIYPLRADDVPLVDDLGIPVVRQPDWPPPTFDLIGLAPHSVELSSAPSRPAGQFHLDHDHPPSSPSPGRHRGKSMVIAYRVTPTNPGRYLEAALRRSGASVTVLDGVLDWDQVPSVTDFVVIVESPYPALEVRGADPGVPVLFWVHHGEHHLAANLRLTRRYRANTVLMAHSWHLAHRFPVPVERFPFAVATELLGRSRRWSERAHDVAMVAAGVGGSGGRYDRRRHLIESLDGDRSIDTSFVYGLAPEEMLAVYEDARIVINDGGRRHLPITMRVFETLGAGALLLTEDLPGTDALLRRDTHYVPLGEDVRSQVHALLADPEGAVMAAAGREWALGHHTYDHRVDQLFDMAAHTAGKRAGAVFAPATPLAALIDRDVDAQHLAVFGRVGDLGLTDRAIRTGDVERLREGSIDAVVIGAGPVRELERAVLAARGYVYADDENAGSVEEILAAHRPGSVISTESGLLRAHLGGTGYRMRPADHPLAL